MQQNTNQRKRKQTPHGRSNLTRHIGAVGNATARAACAGELPGECALQTLVARRDVWHAPFYTTPPDCGRPNRPPCAQHALAPPTFLELVLVVTPVSGASVPPLVRRLLPALALRSAAAPVSASLAVLVSVTRRSRASTTTHPPLGPFIVRQR